MDNLGQIAYEAYCETTNWKSIRGDDLPSWEEQLERNPNIAQAWNNAAQAVAQKLSN
jgi:hypothetical protein